MVLVSVVLAVLEAVVHQMPSDHPLALIPALEEKQE